MGLDGSVVMSIGANMPPEVSHCNPLVTPKTPLLSRVSPRSRQRKIMHQKYFRGKMFSRRRLIPFLVFILSAASIFRFLKITMNTNPSPPLPPMHKSECSSLSLICRKNISHQEDHMKDQLANTHSSSLTEKEMRFLLEFFSRRVPCNLLIFGQDYQYSSIASLNAGGVTIFLEDNLQNASTVKTTNTTQVYKIMYNTLASEAYKLLSDARNSKDCLPNVHLPKVSKCNLVLSNLPQEVYETTWDVVLVDGPSGDTPYSPGKMATIYMASILARSGNMTHVIVHNVDRMIEKWFSWEFLCEENLVSSKGRFWHFHIPGLTNATTFCTT